MFKIYNLQVGYYVVPNCTSKWKYYVLNENFVDGFCNDSIYNCGNMKGNPQLTTTSGVLYMFLVGAGIVSLIISIATVLLKKQIDDTTILKILFQRRSNHKKKQVSYIVGFSGAIMQLAYSEFLTEAGLVQRWSTEMCTQQFLKSILIGIASFCTITVVATTLLFFITVLCCRGKRSNFCINIVYYCTKLVAMICSAAFLLFWSLSTFFLLSYLGLPIHCKYSVSLHFILHTFISSLILFLL